MLEVVADRGPSLLVGVLGFAAAALADGDLAGFLVLPPPVAQTRPRRVAELGNRVGVATIESDEGLYGDPPLLHAEHAVLLLVPFWSKIPSAAPFAFL